MTVAGPTQMKWIALPTWLAAISPALALALFVTAAVHVRLALGHWPMEAVDRSPSALLGFHQFLGTIAFLFGVFAAIPAWLLLLCFRPLRLGFASHMVQAAVLVFGWLVLFWGPMVVSPKYVSWFLD